MAPKSKAEKDYLCFVSQYQSQVFTAHKDSVQEGFEYDEGKKKMFYGFAGLFKRIWYKMSK